MAQMPHRKVTSSDIEVFRAILGAAHVQAGAQISLDYARDELAEEQVLPEVLLEPGSAAEVAQIMQYASAQGLPVTPRGAGTGLCGAGVATPGGVMLATSRLNRILEIDEECLMATVEPGVVLLDFQKEVERRGLFYPPEPGEKSATIGGNVSTNAGGMRAVKYGVTREYVRGLEVVLPGGEIVELGGKLAKNSSGYSLMHLFVGAEGTLGIITKIIVRLVPLPKKRVSLLMPFPSLERAIGAVPKVLTSRTAPTAIEFIQNDVIKAWEENTGKRFPHDEAPAYLLLQFDGNSLPELEAAYETAARVGLDQGAWDALIADTSDRHNVIWEARGAFLEALKARGEVELADAVVPPHLIPAFVTYCDRLGPQFGVKLITFGHAGDGNCHIHIMRPEMDDAAWREAKGRVLAAIFAKAAELGGQISGEHGIGTAKRKYFLSLAPEVNLQMMRRIKACFDPQGIMNPGKVV